MKTLESQNLKRKEVRSISPEPKESDLELWYASQDVIDWQFDDWQQCFVIPKRDLATSTENRFGSHGEATASPWARAIRYPISEFKCKAASYEDA